jgi:hypothetical protein
MSSWERGATVNNLMRRRSPHHWVSDLDGELLTQKGGFQRLPCAAEKLILVLLYPRTRESVFRERTELLRIRLRVWRGSASFVRVGDVARELPPFT